MSNKTIVTVFMNIMMYAVVINNSYRTAVVIINNYRTNHQPTNYSIEFSSKADSLQKYIYSTVLSQSLSC